MRATDAERWTVAALIGLATFGPISSAMAQTGEGGLMLATGAVAVACGFAMFHFGGDPTDRERPGEIARMSESEFDRLVTPSSGHREPPHRERPGEIARMSESEFDRLVEAVERADATLRAGIPPAETPARLYIEEADVDDHFESVVRDALDELPAFLRSALENNVAVLVSDDGHKYRAYGLYVGGTVAGSDYDHRIYVFRDTLVRDFGSDPEELRRQITTTIRHEVAHHLGADERHVAELGL